MAVSNNIKFIFYAAIIFIHSSFSYAQSEWKQIKGSQLGHIISGHHFYDETHYDFFYESSGKISGINMGMQINLNWKIIENKICINDGIQNDCYKLYANGLSYKLKHDIFDIEFYGLVK